MSSLRPRTCSLAIRGLIYLDSRRKKGKILQIGYVTRGPITKGDG